MRRRLLAGMLCAACVFVPAGCGRDAGSETESPADGT